ncbi:GFA family protein [Dyella mobilis]|uniref:GFA family protein n=1 Tax=Dyella mobilis TaxID=1849582 RepID=A0ABS2KEB1_9GAMM|nr:GFA family protein [Dyella mobilis]MBM7129513.1 GFA family protein [Dyella mobilis]GLQ98222.1 aldehyde-activating protein [Dyella mobilis]
MTKRIASCSCGQLSVTTSEDPIRVSICHCLDCQRRSGSVFAVQARFRRDGLELSGTSTRYVRISDEGNRAHFEFCPHCGTTVYYVTEGNEDLVAIPVGAFADPRFPAPVASNYEERMHGWVSMPADIEHHY